MAEKLRVDPKTVERWVGGRVPYRSTRYELSKLLKVDESYIWPGSVSTSQIADASANEVVITFPGRWAVPGQLWNQLFDAAEEEIGILVYSGLFLFENAGTRAILRSKAENGVRVRILIGDHASAELRNRGEEERIEDSLAGKVRNAIVFLESLQGIENIEIRTHRTTLYNSIYRADEQLLVNTHVYGFGATDAPVMHLRQLAGGTMVTTYLESFERVWATARPLPAGP